MPEQRKLILLLHTTHHTMKVEKILKDNKIQHTLVSKPPKVTPGCGIAICFSKKDREKIVKLLQNEDIDYEGIYYEE